MFNKNFRPQILSLPSSVQRCSILLKPQIRILPPIASKRFQSLFCKKLQNRFRCYTLILEEIWADNSIGEYFDVHLLQADRPLNPIPQNKRPTKLLIMKAVGDYLELKYCKY
ncbi:hypothetical protein TNIN_194561 [Trichonephila inaurata madagascariensis]|uniref:Uncharacterized protein n=1 Tax=Trichonephila inaurata madagascariensis TaxID=2747483 RepID=A0A8X6YDB8_9ARAC|nr:hypothetical protein TNIN_194561 [Trichonephila inaurata madagascariensis]